VKRVLVTVACWSRSRVGHGRVLVTVAPWGGHAKPRRGRAAPCRVGLGFPGPRSREHTASGALSRQNPARPRLLGPRAGPHNPQSRGGRAPPRGPDRRVLQHPGSPGVAAGGVKTRPAGAIHTAGRCSGWDGKRAPPAPPPARATGLPRVGHGCGPRAAAPLRDGPAAAHERAAGVSAGRPARASSLPGTPPPRAEGACDHRKPAIARAPRRRAAPRGSGRRARPGSRRGAEQGSGGGPSPGDRVRSPVPDPTRGSAGRPGPPSAGGFRSDRRLGFRSRPIARCGSPPPYPCPGTGPLITAAWLHRAPAAIEFLVAVTLNLLHPPNWEITGSR
jgi:hypothetical protein